MPLVSICIPTYEMNGRGREFLQYSFDKIATQTFRDFDVVISDHSQNDVLEKLCKEYSEQFPIYYHRYTEKRGSSSANINNAIKHATGTLIKILFQDDFLYDNTSLQKTVDHFDIHTDHWLVSAYIHTKDGTHLSRALHPRYTRDVHLGHNKIGTPSGLTIKNDHPLLFDETLLWLMDCEYYKRMHDSYGVPKVLNEITMINRIGAHQVTATLATLEKQKQEFDYVLEKYEHGIAKAWYRFFYSLKHILKITLNHD